MRTHLDDLPEELLSQIIRHFEVPPPSVRSCSEVAAIEQLFCEDVPLKQLSCVSRFWRRMVFPILFRHVSIKLKDILPSPHYCPHVHLCKHDADNCSHHPLSCFAEKYGLADVTTSIIVYQPDDTNSIMALGHKSRWKMWRQLILDFKPQRLTVIVPPRILGAIAGRDLDMSDAWAFKISHQRLELALTTAFDSHLHKHDILGTPYSPGHPSPFHFRPWDTLIYHGGSCLPAFGEYHYFEKQPPCLLSTRDGRDPLGGFRCLTSNLKHLTYQSVFPHLTHMRNLSLVIAQLQGLQSLTLQLTPTETSKVLDDLDLIGRGNLNLRDCWTEVERSYRMVISLCLEPRQTYIAMPSFKTFTSLDCRLGAMDEELTGMMAEHARSWDKLSAMTWIRMRYPVPEPDAEVPG